VNSGKQITCYRVYSSEAGTSLQLQESFTIETGETLH